MVTYRRVRNENFSLKVQFFDGLGPWEFRLKLRTLTEFHLSSCSRVSRHCSQDKEITFEKGFEMRSTHSWCYLRHDTWWFGNSRLKDNQIYRSKSENRFGVASVDRMVSRWESWLTNQDSRIMTYHSQVASLPEKQENSRWLIEWATKSPISLSKCKLDVALSTCRVFEDFSSRSSRAAKEDFHSRKLVYRNQILISLSIKSLISKASTLSEVSSKTKMPRWL